MDKIKTSSILVLLFFFAINLFSQKALLKLEESLLRNDFETIIGDSSYNKKQESISNVLSILNKNATVFVKGENGTTLEVLNLEDFLNRLQFGEYMTNYEINILNYSKLLLQFSNSHGINTNITTYYLSNKINLFPKTLFYISATIGMGLAAIGAQKNIKSFRIMNDIETLTNDEFLSKYNYSKELGYRNANELRKESSILLPIGTGIVSIGVLIHLQNKKHSRKK